MQSSTNIQAEIHAEIEWRDGQPYSAYFQDVYFSTDNGLLEAEYVFLQGNGLLACWQQPNLNEFTIAETGFGTGLNFLSAAKLWLETTPSNATLHYISIEKYPLSLSNISTALAQWPELSELSKPLLTHYNQLIKGSEPLLMFDKRVRLSLLIGDATECLSAIQYTGFRNTDFQNSIDAWFLDGFSPAKNPDMWSAGLFKQMGRLSKQNSTFATFTSAGEVRRGLIAVGFEVNKRPGFGKKREMLIGHFTEADSIEPGNVA